MSKQMFAEITLGSEPKLVTNSFKTPPTLAKFEVLHFALRCLFGVGLISAPDVRESSGGE